ncbi:MAG TPA: hypothetical protein VHS36_03750, partial [Candidatus Limnocylindrales bacterium]|nr:hypothetical protein [Candidatus Limnocylindrales bacterium]
MNDERPGARSRGRRHREGSPSSGGQGATAPGTAAGPIVARNQAEPGPANARWRALLAEGGPILADGAMGTMLFANGLQFGDPPEAWNV